MPEDETALPYDPAMTKEQFEEWYAAKVNATTTQLHYFGFHAERVERCRVYAFPHWEMNWTYHGGWEEGQHAET